MLEAGKNEMIRHDQLVVVCLMAKNGTESLCHIRYGHWIWEDLSSGSLPDSSIKLLTYLATVAR